MKDLIKQINKGFDNKIRLAIMAVLMHKKNLTFNELKEILGTTDGNLSSNATVLEELTYIVVQKKFVKKKSNTSYNVTDKGKEAFKLHSEALVKILQGKF